MTKSLDDDPLYRSLKDSVNLQQLDWVKNLSKDIDWSDKGEWVRELIIRSSALGFANMVSFFIPYASDDALDWALLNASVSGRADEDPRYLACIEILLPACNISRWDKDEWCGVAEVAQALIEQYRLSQNLQPSFGVTKPPRL